MNTIAVTLRAFRHYEGIGQRELAAFLGCRVEQVCRWERGRNKPQRKWLDRMKERGVLSEASYDYNVLNVNDLPDCCE